MGSVENWRAILKRVETAAKEAELPAGRTALVAVSKTFGADDILPVLEAGQRIFGSATVDDEV